MIRFIKFFQIVSIVLFLGIFLFVYSFLPEQVGLTLDHNGMLAEVLSREVFFYSTLVLFALANILITALSRVLRAIPEVRTVEGSARFYNTGSKHAIIAWLKSFGIVINALFIFSLMYVGMLNNIENFQRNDFNFLFYIGPVLVVIWLVMLLIILSKKFNN